MKITKFAGVALLLFTVAMISVAATFMKADFSGEWALDTAKSELGERGGRGVATKLKVTQEDALLTIVRTSTGMNGETTTTDKLTADGKESASITSQEGSSRKATVKWADDHNTLTVGSVTAMSFNGNSFENTGKETWALSADGKTLTIDSESTSQRGVTTVKLVYNKQ